MRLNTRLFKRAFLTVIVIAAAAWAGKQYVFVDNSEEPLEIVSPREQPRRVTPLAPQPDGPPPAGKVWSAEHGHWHDAAATNANGEQIFTPKPQPPGLPPPGKVWSYEHGHWHDSSYTGNENFTPGPPPSGPAPEGKVWSYEHGHWHDADAGNFTPGPPPTGPAPAGKVWSYEHGHWHDADPGQAPTSGQKPVSGQTPPSRVTITPKTVQGGD